MTGGTQRPVVILYEHALLGEGIARHVLSRIGVAATLAPARDAEAVTSALAVDPSIVIFELSRPLEQGDLAALAPHAVLIDVSTAVLPGPAAAPAAPGLESILHAVRTITHSISATPSPAQG